MIALRIKRFCYSETMGTFGHLDIPTFRTPCVEQVWRNNQPWISCIPIGLYPLGPTVWRPGDEDLETIEILHVPGRTDIKLHPANVAEQLYGCVSPGRRLAAMDIDEDGAIEWAVTRSRKATDIFLHRWIKWVESLGAEVTRYNGRSAWAVNGEVLEVEISNVAGGVVV